MSARALVPDAKRQRWSDMVSEASALEILPEDSVSNWAQPEPLPKYRHGGRQGNGGIFGSSEMRREWFRAKARRGEAKSGHRATARRQLAPGACACEGVIGACA